ncbi:M16 family metallopeptidase [Sinanaerobacter chloroacetimidivorans]|uniref:Insulinase family protein n=1 Tax=Sinanaerobacter chloroacetimidivorans TaxID=2818044 RepID=A0A8J7VZA2_9FIRM|nr:pitrilysin family protein [Sinanaerobacter chloroacetimidivorans]MBR0596743.1 insulinase family protein [Sinanaerobacter chloroacetimidivorans]
MIINKTLNCGIRLVMEEIPYVKSVSVGIWVKAGSVDETDKNSGISHFIEHMLFKGTDNRSAKQIAEDVDKIGGQINAFTGKEATCYYIKTLATNIDKAAEILIDMFMNSKFDKIEMEKEKRVVCEEIKMIEDSPEDDAHDIISELVFKGNPLAKSIIGTPSSLKGITQNSIKRYLSEEYTRDNIVISISGSFDQKQVCELFDSKLMKLNPEKAAKSYELTQYQPSYKVKVKDIEQSHLCMGLRGLSIDDERYYALALLNNIMGGSMSSRLFQNIREEKGLAYSVYSMASSFSISGYFNIYAGVSHDKVKDAILGIKEELRLLKQNGVTAEELQTAKEQLKGNYIFSLENVNGRMFSIGKNILLLNKVYTPEETIQNIESVTMEDIKAVSELITDVAKYSGVLIGRNKIDMKKVIQS